MCSFYIHFWELPQVCSFYIRPQTFWRYWDSKTKVVAAASDQNSHSHLHLKKCYSTKFTYLYKINVYVFFSWKYLDYVSTRSLHMYRVIHEKRNLNIKNPPCAYMCMQKYENWARPPYSIAYVYRGAMWMVGFSMSSQCVLNEYEQNDFDKRRKCVFTWKKTLQFLVSASLLDKISQYPCSSINFTVHK